MALHSLQNLLKQKTDSQAAFQTYEIGTHILLYICLIKILSEAMWFIELFRIGFHAYEILHSSPKYLLPSIPAPALSKLSSEDQFSRTHIFIIIV